MGIRKIVFRAKRTDSGEWVYGSLIQFTDGDCIIVPEQENLAFREEYEVCPDTVGQYTGLKDRDGTEIYEGDLLGSKGKVIGWVKGGVRGYCYDVVYINHPAGECDWPLYSTVKADYPEQIEVIGNIHDNPELLEDGK